MSSSSPLYNGGKIITDNSVRSWLDRRSNLLKELPENKLRVQWIYSPEAEKPMMVINLVSGCFNDDHGISGIAHAAEQFLFKRSKKYPLRARVTKQGGRSNKMTSNDLTSFVFEINTNVAEKKAGNKLEEVADVFFHMFISPTWPCGTDLQRGPERVPYRSEGRWSNQSAGVHLALPKHSSWKH